MKISPSGEGWEQPGQQQGILEGSDVERKITLYKPMRRHGHMQGEMDVAYGCFMLFVSPS